MCKSHQPKQAVDSKIIDPQRRIFLLMVIKLLGSFAAIFTFFPFISSWLPSAKTRAKGEPLQVDISSLSPGQQITVEWHGKPVWIIRRTKEMLSRLAVKEDVLRDPDSLVKQQPDYAKNRHRSINPEYLVLIGICTHLGCTPKYMPQLNELGQAWRGGFYCPCHGSSFDLAGRVYKGVPAPINLQVPPHHFVNETMVVIGSD